MSSTLPQVLVPFWKQDNAFRRDLITNLLSCQTFPFVLSMILTHLDINTDSWWHSWKLISTNPWCVSSEDDMKIAEQLIDDFVTV